MIGRDCQGLASYVVFLAVKTTYHLNPIFSN